MLLKLLLQLSSPGIQSMLEGEMRNQSLKLGGQGMMVNSPHQCLTVKSDSRRAQGGATHGGEGQEDLSVSSGLLAHRGPG